MGNRHMMQASAVLLGVLLRMLACAAQAYDPSSTAVDRPDYKDHHCVTVAKPIDAACECNGWPTSRHYHFKDGTPDVNAKCCMRGRDRRRRSSVAHDYGWCYCKSSTGGIDGAWSYCQNSSPLGYDASGTLKNPNSDDSQFTTAITSKANSAEAAAYVAKVNAAWVTAYGLTALKQYIGGTTANRRRTSGCEPTYGRVQFRTFGNPYLGNQYTCYDKYGYSADGTNKMWLLYGKASCFQGPASKLNDDSLEFFSARRLARCFRAPNAGVTDLHQCLVDSDCGHCQNVVASLTEVSCGDSAFVAGVKSFGIK